MSILYSLFFLICKIRICNILFAFCKQNRPLQDKSQTHDILNSLFRKLPQYFIFINFFPVSSVKFLAGGVFYLYVLHSSHHFPIELLHQKTLLIPGLNLISYSSSPFLSDRLFCFSLLSFHFRPLFVKETLFFTFDT